ncbi:MAG: hypothetical protein A2Y12_16565 [Planctomycetes bacterium GWF2_42_9]|nr:MAG: hypothetical protein A2Y12_16565 [Planctomycetes bacterium GWF2_42_9]
MIILRLFSLIFLICLVGCARQKPIPQISGGPADPNSPQAQTIKSDFDLQGDTDFLIKPSLNNQPSMHMHHSSSEPEQQLPIPQTHEKHNEHESHEQTAP